LWGSACCFDRDVSSKLNALASLLKAVSEKMKEYFAQARNEMNYYPEEDLDDVNPFQIHLVAYSGVEIGTHFEVDIEKGTVEVISSVNGFDKASKVS
jgi:hypothetical protein